MKLLQIIWFYSIFLKRKKRLAFQTATLFYEIDFVRWSEILVCFEWLCVTPRHKRHIRMLCKDWQNEKKYITIHDVIGFRSSGVWIYTQRQINSVIAIYSYWIKFSMCKHILAWMRSHDKRKQKIKYACVWVCLCLDKKRMEQLANKKYAKYYDRTPRRIKCILQKIVIKYRQKSSFKLTVD